VDAATLRERFKAANIKTRYYNPDIHTASFSLPQYVLEAIGKADNS
jgi:spermidine synthase